MTRRRSLRNKGDSHNPLYSFPARVCEQIALKASAVARERSRALAKSASARKSCDPPIRIYRDVIFSRDQRQWRVGRVGGSVGAPHMPPDARMYKLHLLSRQTESRSEPRLMLRLSRCNPREGQTDTARERKTARIGNLFGRRRQ